MPEVREIAITLIVDNELSVNEEDTYTFNRLKLQIEKHGLLELPVVREDGDGKYKIISGHHRIKAWRSLGNTVIKAVVMPNIFQSKEEEFNLVNNFNTVRGNVRKQTLIAKAKEEKLNVNELDIFKYPVSKLFPFLSIDDMQQQDDEQRRRAKINSLTLVVAKEIAKTLVDEKDELISIVCVNDRAAAILRLPFKSGVIARDRAGEVKKAILNGLGEAGINA